MAQHATSILRNVKASVEKYFQDTFVTGESIDVDFEGMPFESGATNYTEWLQPRLLAFNDPTWKPKATSTTRGNVASVLLNTNCFVNKSNVTTANRHYFLRDRVNNYLYSGASIPLRDYIGGTTRPFSTLMKVEDIETDTAIPNEDLYHYNYTVRLEWIRQWGD